MVKKPKPPKPISWNVYKLASKAVLAGEVQAPDEAGYDGGASPARGKRGNRSSPQTTAKA
jgi:hypothetical protein